MKTNPCLQAALGELEAAGIRDVVVVPGGKHPQIRWKVNGHALRVFTVAGSPSDWRAPKNTRSDIRRALRADGVLTAPAPRPPQQPARKPDRIGDLERRVAVLEQELLRPRAAASAQTKRREANE
jgi:hypothetical protein